MITESGRSLIEIIGVLAVAAIMTAGAITTYNVLRNRSARTIASAELEQMVKNIRLLMQPRGDYNGVSVDYLVKAGALRHTHAPIGDDGWTINAYDDGAAFAINLVNLSHGDCAYFTTAVPTWTTAMQVNGYENDAGAYCMSSGGNQVTFIVE